MNTLNLILIIIFFLALVVLFFFVCSKVYNTAAGFGVFGLIFLTAALCFLTIEKKQVIRIDGQEFKIANISYYCPRCNNYISGLETQYCGRCGAKLRNNTKDF